MLHHSCKTCKHWQGNKLSKWADCNWVVGVLEPELFNERNEFGYKFIIPFDPHHVYYFDSCSNFHKLYRQATKILPTGIRIDKIRRLKFIQTRKDYKCELYAEHCPTDGST